MKDAKEAGISFDDYMADEFRGDPGHAVALRNLILSEEDRASFLVVLRQMAKAFGGVSKVAGQANLNETTIYRLLSGQGNPQLSSIMAILRVMGLRLAVVPAATEGAFAAQAAEGLGVPVEAEVASV